MEKLIYHYIGKLSLEAQPYFHRKNTFCCNILDVISRKETPCTPYDIFVKAILTPP